MHPVFLSLDLFLYSNQSSRQLTLSVQTYILKISFFPLILLVPFSLPIPSFPPLALIMSGRQHMCKIIIGLLRRR